MFINKSQSILAPSYTEILKCLSVCLYWKMKEFENKDPKVFLDIFEEEGHPLGNVKHNPDTITTPDIDKIHSFLKKFMILKS